MQDSIGAMAAGVRSGRTRARDVVDAYVDRLVRTEGTVHAYLAVLADEAHRRAEQIDRLPLSERSRLPLAGVPIALKDNIVWTDGPTTAGSRILENFRSPYAATAAVRLSDAGAIIIGKTNLDEFAMGSSTEHSAYGPTHNPWDPKRVPGGSSGGSAAAVAVGSAAAALGSDTGGSIRQPAAYCGVVGLKPTYGRVSRYGLVAFASSLDQIGPLTRHVEDAARLLQVMAGYDARDLTSLAAPVPDWTAALDQGVKSLTVGVVEEYLEGLDAPVARAMERAERILREAGAKVARVHLPNSRYGLPAYYVMANAEASSNLARYDGVRYGLRVAADGLYQQYDETRRTGFGAEVQRRIMLGTFALSAGYFDAYYRQAARVRRAIADDFAGAFEQASVLLTPTTPDQPFRLGERLADPWRMYLSDLFTVGVNLAGLPALSLPAGTVGGLPVGVQLIAPALQEARLFQFGTVLEEAFAPLSWPDPV